jgi:hypothetical protein
LALGWIKLNQRLFYEFRQRLFSTEVSSMFGLFKSDPAKKLRKQYSAKLEEAMQAQRTGDIRSYATLTEEAQALWAKLEPLERDKA